MSNNKNRRSKVVAVCTIWVSVFCHLVWPCVLYEVVKAEDRQAWLWGREPQVDYVSNGVVVWTKGRWFLHDVVAHHGDAWDEYKIPAEQVDAVLVQLMLLDMHMQCVVDPEFFVDDAKENVR